MAIECTQWPAGSNYLSCFLTEKIESKSTCQMYEWARQAVEWLRKAAACSTQGKVLADSGASSASSAAPAIMDGTVHDSDS